MKVVVAEPETLQGANVLDDSVRGVFENVTPADITGALAQDHGFGGGDEQIAWMRPAVGAEPAMRFSALVQMAGAWGGTQLVAPAEIFSLPDGGLVRFVFYTLTVTIGQVGTELKALRWRMEPGGDDATRRADALNLLDALHMGGVLTISDERTDHVVQTMAVEPQELDRELARARPFLERVALLEEWSGTPIPIPVDVDADELAQVFRTAAIVLAREVPMVLSEHMTVTVRGELDAADIDELRLPRALHETILGVEIPLGEVQLVVGVSVEEVTPTLDGLLRLECRLTDDQPRQLSVELEPPSTRSRFLRRTLVAGSTIPPSPALQQRRVEARSHQSLATMLEQLEQEDGPVDPELVAHVRSQWRA